MRCILGFGTNSSFPQIYTLRSSLALLEARTSHLHNRLLATLDTLDDVQYSRSEEIDDLTREKNTLVKRVELMRLELKSANDERENMQDAILRLIEKGSDLYLLASGGCAGTGTG